MIAALLAGAALAQAVASGAPADERARLALIGGGLPSARPADTDGSRHLEVVGNLEGWAEVDVAPRVALRLASVSRFDHATDTSLADDEPPLAITAWTSGVALGALGHVEAGAWTLRLGGGAEVSFGGLTADTRRRIVQRLQLTPITTRTDRLGGWLRAEADAPVGAARLGGRAETWLDQLVGVKLDPMFAAEITPVERAEARRDARQSMRPLRSWTTLSATLEAPAGSAITLRVEAGLSVVALRGGADAVRSEPELAPLLLVGVAGHL